MNPEPWKQVNGDDIISSNLVCLWEMTFYCLVKFQCPVIFKHSGMNVPAKIPEFITFYIPRGHEQYDEVEKFLLQELSHHRRDPVYIEKWDHHDPGTVVQVVGWRGLQGYVPRDEFLATHMPMFMRMMEEIRDRALEETDAIDQGESLGVREEDSDRPECVEGEPGEGPGADS